jgi:PAS domain S-box-containing protein
VTAPRRRRSEVLTQAIVASAPDAVVVVDDDGAVVEFNPAAERMFGVRRDTVIGSELSDGMLLPRPPSERAPLDGSYEATARRSDGSTFPAEVSTAPVVGVDAGLRVLYVRDISERRRAQRAVYDLAAIIESSDDAIISKTLEGVIESWNAGAERLYGHTAAEAIGQRISLVEPLGRPDQSPAVLALDRRARPIANFETVRVRKDGTEVHVSLTVSPIVDARGRVIAAAEIGRDITARKRTDQRVAYLAYHDDLTGLPNRLMFGEHLDLALARAQRHGRGGGGREVGRADF